MKLWTGGKIPANPPQGSTPQGRRSLVYFHHPSPEVVVTPPTGDPSKSVTAEDYILAPKREGIPARSL